MSVSKTVRSNWMGITGNSKTTSDNVFAGPAGWYIKHPSGQIELIQCISGAAESIINAPNIDIVDNTVDGSYSIAAGDTLIFVVNWSEPVDINVTGGVPYMSVTIGGDAVSIPLIGGSKTGATTSTFSYDVDSGSETGALVLLTPSVVLNSGTIKGSDAIDAEGDIVVTNDTVSSVTMLQPGSAYAGTETVTFDAPNKVNVNATVAITQTGGIIDTVEIVEGGYGYEDGVIAIAGGTGGTITATVTDGVITGVVLTAPGTGYSDGTENLAAPTLSVTTATADLTFTTGAISAVTMTENGYGYDGTESVTFDPSTGTDAVLTRPASYVQPTGVTVGA